MSTFGKIVASLSGLFVTVFGGWALYDFVSKVQQALEMEPTLTLMQIFQNGGGLNLALVVTLLIVGLNIFLPNCILLKKLCNKEEKQEETVEVVKA